MTSSTSSAALPNSFTISPLSVVCVESSLLGQISIGSNTIIHPKAIINASKGPISIGSNCIVEEFSVLESSGPHGLTIGDWNLFEVGCRVSASKIGHGNLFEVRSVIPACYSIGSGCTIGQLVSLPIPSAVSETRSVADSHVIIGPQQLTKVKADNEKSNIEDMKPRIELLRESLTKTHKLIK